MGLAQRFREQLKNRDIFEDRRAKTINKPKTTVQTSERTSDIIYDLDTDNIFKITNYTTNVIKNSTKNVYKPATKKDELKTSILAKISKTPCWDDYSIKMKTTMLEKYFDTKMKGQSYTKTERGEFINSILNNK